jgi:hypothetical protein
LLGYNQAAFDLCGFFASATPALQRDLPAEVLRGIQRYIKKGTKQQYGNRNSKVV